MKTNDIYVLNPKAWHMKLMTWIWGFTQYDFNFMCNYFWLSVLNVIIAIPVAIVKLGIFISKKIGKTFGKGFEAFDNYCERREEKWFQDNLERLKKEWELGDKSDLINKLSKYYDSYDTRSEMSSKYRKLVDNLPYIEKNILLAISNERYDKRIEEKRVKREANYSKEVLRKKKIGKLAIYAKNFIKVLGVIVAGFILYLLYLLIAFLITLNWGKIFEGILAAVVILIAAVLIVLLVHFLIKGISYLVCRYGTYCVPCENRRNKLAKFFSIIGSGIAYPFIQFGKGIVFLFEIIVELKENHCPAIEWKQDDQS